MFRSNDNSNRKSIHNFLSNNNSDVYHIWHSLRDNHIRTFLILSIRIFDLKVARQGHEKQRGVLHRYMADCKPTIYWKKCESILNPLRAVHRQKVYAHIIAALPCLMLKIENFQLTLKISHRVTNLKCDQAKKFPITRLHWTTGVSCSTDGKTTKTKKRQYERSQCKRRCLQDQQPLVIDSPANCSTLT